MDETNDWFIKTKIKRTKKYLPLDMVVTSGSNLRPLKDEAPLDFYMDSLLRVFTKPVYEGLINKEQQTGPVGRLRILLSLSMRLSARPWNLQNN